MIVDKFNPDLPLPYVRYGRMSGDEQNPRSPDQQFDDIDRTKKKQGRDNWVHVMDFRDDAISGRYKRKRPAFAQMLDMIRCGRLRIDAILVDTIERFARLKDLPAIRDELRKKHGVVVLTSDTGFADPTSMVGQVYTAMESIRASSAGAQKAHDVLRGKIDVVMMKRWPGGPPPCGYRLAARTETITRRNGKTLENPFHVLEPDPATMEIAQRVYRLALENGWGRTRIAKFLNADPEFAKRYGQVSESLVGCIMTSTTYKGVYRFNFLATDIDDDCRVVGRKDPDEVIYVDAFCEPIVDPGIVDKVHADVRRRSEKQRQSRKAKKESDGKQIQPLSSGLVLVYPMAGLVRCGMPDCRGAMLPTKSGAKSRDAASYYYYRCPRAADGRCANKLYVRGPWLWQVVTARLREKLFPLPDETGVCPVWLNELIAAVRPELLWRLEADQDRRPVLEKELKDLDSKKTGWNESLSKSDLPPSVRTQIEQQYGAALQRQEEISIELDMLAHGQQHIHDLLDARAAIDRLRRLDEVLAGSNPSDMNVELARHIDSILVHPDGNVIMRANRLGIFEGVSEILAGERDDLDALYHGGDGDGDGRPIRRRALARRRTTGSDENSPLARPDGLIDQHVDLPEKWIDEAIFRMPERTSWARDNAEAVFLRRQEAKLSYAKLGEEYDVTGPTARAAVFCYLDEHPEAKDEVNLRRGGKRPPKFDVSKFGHEARELWEAGWSKLKLAEKYECSTPTIDKAIEWSYQQVGRTTPTRGERKEAKVRQARQLLDAGRTLEEVKQALGVSDVTTRAYLRASFEAEGKPMPDLRKRD